MQRIDKLFEQIRACRLCEAHLPLGPRPVIRGAESARLLIIGQAPGTRVHASGIPWDDPSGDRLRQWLGVDKPTFYDESRIAIMPMGLCYPGKGKSGDLPPRPECAPAWHDKVLMLLPNIELTLLIGQYAQAYYLRGGSQEIAHRHGAQLGRLWPRLAAVAASLPAQYPLAQKESLVRAGGHPSSAAKGRSFAETTLSV